MGFEVDMGAAGLGLLVIGAMVIGIGFQLIGDVRFGYEWVVTAIAAFVGALAASEFIVDWRAVGPVWDGIALAPALIGALVVGMVVEVVFRYSSGGSLLHGPHVA